MNQQKSKFHIVIILAILVVVVIMALVYVTKSRDESIKEARVQELIDGLDGDYFTVDNKACYSPVDRRCDENNVVHHNIRIVNLVEKNIGKEIIRHGSFPGHYNLEGGPLENGYSCCGFANFAAWYIGADTINSDVNCKYEGTHEFNYKSLKKYVQTGDIARSYSHSFIINIINNDGCWVIDANWDGDCKIRYHLIPWDMFDKVSISRI